MGYLLLSAFWKLLSSFQSSSNICILFDKKIFKTLEDDFKKFAGTYYSPFKITKILESIDELIDDNELQFVTHSVSETVDDNFIDLEFKIFEIGQRY